MVLITSCSKPETVPAKPTAYYWKKPVHFPDPVYDFSRNPITEEGVKLGKLLFYDGIMSRNNMVSCGTCHQQQNAFSQQGHRLSQGVDDLLGTRNTPSLQNMAWNPSFFWDGGVHDLDFTILNPIENPVEMDENIPSIIKKLKTDSIPGTLHIVDYPGHFKNAFGTEEITTGRIMKAMSQFMLTMISAGSRYDLYLAGNKSVLNKQEKEGLDLFAKNCSSCHNGVLFTDHSFRNNGLTPFKNNDKGRYEITGNENDYYKFKVPSLRNIAITFPYMHDGRYQSLDDVLKHYSDSITVSYNSEAGKTLDPFLINLKKNGTHLTPYEQKTIVAFLHTLTDEVFIKDAKLSNPENGHSN